MENMDKIQIVCADCGQIIAEVDRNFYELYVEDVRRDIIEIGSKRVIVYYGECYCPDCQNDFAVCSECGCVINLENDNHEHDDCNNIYCQDCADRYLNYCDHCESYTRGDTIQVFNDCGRGKYWCEDCVENNAHQCEDCGTYYSLDVFFRETIRNEWICEDCADDNYNECSECGILIPEGYQCSCDGEYLCSVCYEQLKSNRVIHDYHRYPSDWVFRNMVGTEHDYIKEFEVRHKQLHIGIEQEIDFGGTDDDNAIEITEALGYPADESTEFKCSRDGSLNDGFEIISMPATYEYHLKRYNWEKGMKKAMELGYKSHDAETCGLHFHVDRSYFIDSMTIPEEGFIIIATNNMDWLKTFSRRKDYGYCEFKNATPFTVEDFKADKCQLTQYKLNTLRNSYSGHHVALNFSNGGTIELRFIRGTLKYSTFVASLQLVEMISYAVKHFRKEQLANVNLQWFKRFAEKRGYTEFKEYLSARGIMG